jgi:hypothetical protein
MAASGTLGEVSVQGLVGQRSGLEHSLPKREDRKNLISVV